jgi:hypothetical protein
MRIPLAAAAALLLLAGLAGCSSPPGTTGSIHGTAMVGPTCPVEHDPPEEGCEDQPYEGDLVVVKAGGEKVVARFVTGEEGTFEVSVAPGTYDIRSPSDQTLPACSTQEPVVVEEGRTAEADVSCDSGIR